MYIWIYIKSRLSIRFYKNVWFSFICTNRIYIIRHISFCTVNIAQSHYSIDHKQKKNHENQLAIIILTIIVNNELPWYNLVNCFFMQRKNKWKMNFYKKKTKIEDKMEHRIIWNWAIFVLPNKWSFYMNSIYNSE